MLTSRLVQFGETTRRQIEGEGGMLKLFVKGTTSSNKPSFVQFDKTGHITSYSDVYFAFIGPCSSTLLNLQTTYHQRCQSTQRSDQVVTMDRPGLPVARRQRCTFLCFPVVSIPTDFFRFKNTI